MEVKIIIILAAIIALVHSEPYGQCPPDENPATPTHLPDTEDCTKFYKCLYGEPILHGCPPGQEWSLENSYCDFPENAKCVRPLDPNSTPGPTSSVAPPSTSSQAPSDNKPYGTCPPDENPSTPTHLPDAEDCSKFYKCLYGEPILHFCPPGQEWFLENSYCDFPENAKCVRPLDPNSTPGPTSSVAPSSTSSQAPSDNKPYGTCPPDENPSTPTHLPDAEDCSKFYKCLYGEPILHFCPPGQEWSLENSYCDFPENAKCVRPLDPNSTPGPTSSVAPSSTSSQAPSDNKPYGTCPPDENSSTPTHLPDAEDCSKFYKCLYGEPILHFCPPGQEWSLENSYCDFPENAKCVRPLDPDSTPGPTSTVAPPSTTSVALSSTSPVTPTSSQSPLDDVCKDVTENPGFALHEYDCQKYYMCSNGRAYLFTCPGTLYFSMKLRACDYPANVVCDN